MRQRSSESIVSALARRRMVRGASASSTSSSTSQERASPWMVETKGLAHRSQTANYNLIKPMIDTLNFQD